jgi:DNA mismatch repair protein MutS
MAKVTPMMAQYKEIKAKYSDCILFFRLGDFYEMFFDDALTASKILDIVLTSRNKGDGKAPMCGIPYHAASQYISKLTKAGKKVAICEQVSDPKEPGLVKRDVVRVVTPGTTLDDKLLETKSNNFIASVVLQDEVYGIAFADITTGEFKVFETENFEEEIERIAPTECILETDSSLKLPDYIHTYEFESYRDSEQILLDHFEVKNMDSFGLKDMRAGLCAAGRLLHYLQETQKTDLSHIRKIQPFHADDFMPLDEASIRNLEIFTTLRDNLKEGSLISVLDETLTAMGGRSLKKFLMRPLVDRDAILKRLEAVDEFCKTQTLLLDLRDLLKNVSDIERTLGRLSLNSGNARDLVSLKNSFLKIPEVKKFLKGVKSKLLKKLSGNLDDLRKLVTLIDKAICEEPPLTIKDGGMIKEGFDKELDKLKKISREGKGYIKDLQAREVKRTGISSLKVKYNKVFGYYIEISKSNLANVPEDYMRKQTLVNAERFITPELKEYEETVLNAEEKMYDLEYEIFETVKEKVIKETHAIQKTAENLGILDVLLSFATTALHNHYCKPEINEGAEILIKNGRHPVVEKMTFSSCFIPNDTLLNDEEQITLITGPNMAGKSCYLRQVALIALMTHIGSFVPADSAKICLLDRIFTRIGASDNLVRGQSTFMVEMQETSYILNNATEKSLIILDEIGRGTSTYDGMSIAWAITEYVHNTIRAKTLFATHYHELISVADKLERTKNKSFLVKENEKDGVVFLYKLAEGGVDKSYGVEVAKLAGLPASVTSNALKILKDLEEGVLEKGIETKLQKEIIPEDQMNLFAGVSEREHSALSKLKGIDVNSLTPIEALQKLDELKKYTD